MNTNVGCKVYFECQDNGNPRWNFADDDIGAPSQWFNEGTITHWDQCSKTYLVKYKSAAGVALNWYFLDSDVPDGKLLFVPWPNRVHVLQTVTPSTLTPSVVPTYMKDLGSATGFLPIKEKKESPCCCGALVCKTTHQTYCPMFENHNYGLIGKSKGWHY